MPAPHAANLAAAAWISLALLAAGCASGAKEDILPQDGPTMKQVYDGHFGRRPAASGGRQAGPRPAADADGPAGYARDAGDAVNAQFPRLPNPDLVIYVFPHLSAKGYPVPGYATAVPMWQGVEYALPGEAEGWQ
jgi:conjugative transfer region lipoprotein (TIGR03751 family)